MAKKLKTFARNLEHLLFLKDLNKKEASKKVGVPYKWMRRMATRGIGRPDPRNLERLQKLAEFFGLPSVDDLWRKDLLQLGVPKDLPTLKESLPKHLTKSTCVDRFTALLDSEEFDDLYDLVDELYKSLEKVPSYLTLVFWAGSKWFQAGKIVEYFPKSIETYHEPFIGGGSMLYELLKSDIRVERIECSDGYEPLIGIWRMVQDGEESLMDEYEKHWKQMREKGQSYFYQIRDEYNEVRKPCQLFFLLRSCKRTTALFNKKGEFIAGYRERDRGGSGINPQKLQVIFEQWYKALAKVEFSMKDYRKVRTKPSDFMYLDPPYQSVNYNLYPVDFDIGKFFQWLEGQPCGYALSLEGFVNDEDRRVDVPKELYDDEIQIEAAPRLFDRRIDKVTDSLYVKYPR